ncbi:MAG: SdpI family protein [Gemmatimonadota bacterium]|nr:SdpI family protein [Gemmatimonadota bacterium]
MRKWYPALVAALALAATALVYGRLPERIPVHWNLAGEVDRYGSRLEGALLLPAVITVMAALIPLLPRLDPRGANYEKFRPTYHLVMNAVLTFMLLVHVALLAHGLGHAFPVHRVIPAGVGLLLMLLGNVLPRTRPNWMFGIRTPWTLSSDRVWERTHRVGGYLMLGAGLVTVLAAALPDPRGSIAVLTAAVLVAAVGSIAYSFVAWRQEKRS